MPYKDPEKEQERQRRRRRTPEWQDYHREYGKQWRAENPDKQAEYDRRYRTVSPGKASAKKERYRASDPERARRNDRQSKTWLTHGLRPDDWARKFAEQEGRCCYCRRPLSPAGGREVVVDHDHTCCGPRKSCSACQRGLACAACNKIIGLAYEDPEVLETIAASLRILAAQARARIAGKPVQVELPIAISSIEHRREAGQ